MSNAKNKVELLPLPWPYKSAMAISSDIDDCPPELFGHIHTFLNTEEETPMGRGLGLEISDSLWLWSHDNHLVSLLDDENKLRNYSNKLASLCHSGWIDAFHSMGDFNTVSGFTRDKAGLGYKILNDLGIRLETYINHGNRQNHQNFSCRLANSYLGDDPDSKYYHSDLALEHGIRFYWWDELVDTPLSCLKPSAASSLRLFLDSTIKNSIKTVMGKGKSTRSRESLKELMVPYQLKDANSLWAFTRYNYYPGDLWARPGRHSFKHQLREEFLQELISQAGYAVLYTHFGQPQWQEGDDILDGENLAALKRLQQLYQDKEILVAATGRLLNYWLISKYLMWSSEESQNELVININGIDEPVSGKQNITPEQLEGITFRHRSKKNVKILLQDQEVEGYKTQENNDEAIVYFPWQKLALPSGGFYLK